MIEEAQPLNIATASQLTEAREFLCEAAILVTDVKAILSDRGYVATVDRIKEIEGRRSPIRHPPPPRYRLTQPERATAPPDPNARQGRWISSLR